MEIFCSREALRSVTSYTFMYINSFVTAISPPWYYLSFLLAALAAREIDSLSFLVAAWAAWHWSSRNEIVNVICSKPLYLTCRNTRRHTCLYIKVHTYTKSKQTYTHKCCYVTLKHRHATTRSCIINFPEKTLILTCLCTICIAQMCVYLLLFSQTYMTTHTDIQICIYTHKYIHVHCTIKL